MASVSHLEILKNRGFDPKTCIDIGAYMGMWAANWKTIFPKSKVLMIDPLDSVEPMLSSMAEKYPDDFAYEKALLWRSSGVMAPFYEMDTGSSIHEESSHFPRSRAMKRTETLHGIIERHPEFRSPDFIKLDTQGSELSILSEEREVVSRVRAVQIEASLVPVNKRCPLIGAVIAFMENRDFVLSDIFDENRMNDGTLWQVDLIFVRRDSGLEGPSALTPELWT
jgi:FkbM family methyltransferase